jgi:hypothetical protein
LKGEGGSQMLSQKTYKIWRIINLALLVVGLIMPWFGIVSDLDLGRADPTNGWEHLSFSIVFGIPYFLNERLDVFTISRFLTGLSGILLFFYFMYNFRAAQKDFARNRIISAMLLGIVTAILWNIFLGLSESPYSGLWVFTLGIFSCLALEWDIDFRTKFDPDVLLLPNYGAWRAVNMCIIIAGIMIIWNDVWFEYFLTALYASLFWRFGLENNFLLYTTLFYSALLSYYLAFNLISILERKIIRDLRIVSLVLFGTIPIPALMWHIPTSGRGYWGFLITVFGVCSSAILEWRPRHYVEVE